MASVGERPAPAAPRVRLDPHPSDPAVRRLDRFLRMTLVTSVVCVPLVLVLAVLSGGDRWLVALAVLIAGNIALTAGELRLLRSGDAARAVVVYAFADWMIALAVVGILPAMLPVSASVVALPVVTAMPFLGRSGIVRLAAAGAAVMVGAALLGTVQDVTHLSDRLPPGVTVGLLLTLLPFIWTYTALNASSTSARLVDALRAAGAATAQVRASRARIVAAGDAERRRVERNLHDGAQQHLLALRMQLTATRSLADRLDDPDGALLAALDRLDAHAVRAADELRSLARGLFPAVLVERGVPDALRTVAAGLPERVSLDVAPGLGRFTPAIEAAAYFTCLEAVQNAVRHAGGTAHVTVRVRVADELLVDVDDDGPGLPDDAAARGSGLASMDDRIAAVGGRLAVTPGPDGGTRVSVALPALR